MVTHDQEEALSMADRIVVMNHGVIEQIGTPTEIYRAPRSLFVADFIGETNRIHSTLSAPGSFTLGDTSLLGMTDGLAPGRSEEHTSELQSLMRISYAVFCLKKKTVYNTQQCT